ncbi:MAG: sigma 54-interacting transcriptional regulator [Desulfobacterales bacterium]|jgi:transcriptional regulator with GAF, ATPase, and Fis domain
MRPLSLKNKLLIAVSITVIGSGLLISLVVTQRYSSSLFASLNAQAENIAQAVALDATDKILTNDLVSLQKMLDYHISSDPNIAYIFIVKDNQVLAHSFIHGIPIELLGANDTILDNYNNHKEIISTKGDRYLDIARPIFSGKAGLLRLGISEKPYRDQVAQLWLQMSGLTLAILLLALAGSLLFIKRITGPLALLAGAAEKIDAGNLDVKIELKSQDEVGKLTAAFKHMVSRIKDYTQRLEDKTSELDRAHRQTHTSFAIAKEIGALTHLRDVCTYLIKRLQEIVTCNEMCMLILSNDSDHVFLQTENEFRVLDIAASQKAVSTLIDLDKMSFLTNDTFNAAFLPDQFKSAKNLMTFPLHYENQLQGAMLIACPGNCNCVTKELDIIDLILNQTAGAIRRSVIHEEEIRELRTRIEHTAEFSGIIGKDPQMQNIFRLIEDIAPTDATVLIQGESGTGKELVARAIHGQSPRRSRPFIVINCSAYPETLLESELFGHEKGAFTGAIRQKIGRFEQANGGTVFLDEIGEIAPSAQIKLLRVLQSQKFERVGGEETLKVNIRILAATNKDLLKEVTEGRFREDLFYRLNVIPIQLPPLRARRNDIPLLARHFLHRFAAEQHKEIQEFRSEAMRRLLDYPWPGNVRELENSIEHTAVLAKRSTVEISDLPTAIRDPAPSAASAAPGTIEENEKKLLQEVLEECDWNKKKAALQLGISRSTLYEKLKKYQIMKPTIH